MIRVQTTPALSYTSLSIADMGQRLEAIPLTPMNAVRITQAIADHDEELANGRNDGWLGELRSSAEAERVMAQGWADGAARALALAPALRHDCPPPRSIRRRPTFGPDGYEMHIDRALNGDWETAWRTTTKVERTSGSGLVRLAASFGGNCDRSAEEMFMSGLQMLVATDLLEASGYRVELHALCALEQSQQAFVGQLIDVRVKDYQQPLRSDLTAALFAHAGVFRTFGFRLIGTCAYKVRSSLGRVQPSPAEYAALGVDAGFLEPFDYIMPEAITLSAAAENIGTLLTTLTPGES